MEFLILSILNWKVKAGLKRITAIRSQRANQELQIELDEENGMETTGEPLQPLTIDEELEYAYVRVPDALLRKEPRHKEEPEYATVVHHAEESASVEMMSNEAYTLVHLVTPA